MTESENPEPAEEELEFSTIDPSYDVVESTLDTFLAAASVDSVYGEPVQYGETLVIPAAEVVSFLGFGVGAGSGGGPSDDEGGGGSGGGGSGGGGGGRIFSRPVAVVIATPTGVRVEPVVDVTKIALAVWTALAFMFGMMLRMRNPRKALKDLNKGDWG
jgi:uncharacterized spore protein YtfJ